ncbi:F0F1 ATP synthase subunit delta [Coxiella endosymbiont of Amblyomma nuttalli]|uniref:F0F1 ATP synthase subunit delta n=1 Tax=Coxiella endosymbiont of Amblyomma nuttalli TaxID=2749996 RepID=UPI001BABCC06|nr:F0F1 ATP synthase subunit delta [Coxiella endosymbiont of Amblyomma nuttalli]QTS84227.1 ATP synthase subunit delta [Coxiella endosymbiont of Amblyomma nuttalli]
MTLQLTVARPYARAIFTDAKKNHRLKMWSAVFNVLSKLVKNKQIAQLIINPRISNQEFKELLLYLIQTIQVETSSLKEEIDHFLQLLINEKRLMALPDIAFLYHRLLNNYRGIVEAEVICAFPLNAEYRGKIKNNLEKRFNSKVKLKVTIDKSLLGGAIIRSGNWVMDGSIKGKLTRLAESLRR